MLVHRPATADPHVVVHNDGSRTHFLGAVDFALVDHKPNPKPEKSEEHPDV